MAALFLRDATVEQRAGGIEGASEIPEVKLWDRRRGAACKPATCLVVAAGDKRKKEASSADNRWGRAGG